MSDESPAGSGGTGASAGSSGSGGSAGSGGTSGSSGSGGIIDAGPDVMSCDAIALPGAELSVLDALSCQPILNATGTAQDATLYSDGGVVRLIAYADACYSVTIEAPGYQSREVTVFAYAAGCKTQPNQVTLVLHASEAGAGDAGTDAAPACADSSDKTCPAN